MARGSRLVEAWVLFQARNAIWSDSNLAKVWLLMVPRHSQQLRRIQPAVRPHGIAIRTVVSHLTHCPVMYRCLVTQPYWAWLPTQFQGWFAVHVLRFLNNRWWGFAQDYTRPSQIQLSTVRSFFPPGFSSFCTPTDLLSRCLICERTKHWVGAEGKWWCADLRWGAHSKFYCSLQPNRSTGEWVHKSPVIGELGRTS